MQVGPLVHGDALGSGVIEGGADDLPPMPAPDEPVYCLCGRGSAGMMIACENAECAIEW